METENKIKRQKLTERCDKKVKRKAPVPEPEAPDAEEAELDTGENEAILDIGVD